MKRKDLLKIELQPFDIIHYVHGIRIDRRRRGAGSNVGCRRIWRIEYIHLDQNLFLRQKRHEDSVIVRVSLNQVEFQCPCAIGEDLLVAGGFDDGLFL